MVPSCSVPIYCINPKRRVSIEILVKLLQIIVDLALIVMITENDKRLGQQFYSIITTNRARAVLLPCLALLSYRCLPAL